MTAHRSTTAAQAGGKGPERRPRAVDSRKSTVDTTGSIQAVSRASQTLVLDGYPTLEQQALLGPNTGSRRWGVAEERANVQKTTGVEARRQRIVKVPPPVHATYTFVVPDRARRDWDNYALICKPVQDGLVKAEILVGDDYAVLTGVVLFRVEKGQRRLEVTLTQSAQQRGEGPG